MPLMNKITGVSKGIGLVKIIKNIILIIAVMSLFFSAYNVFQQTGKISPVIEKVGGELFNPFYNLDLAVQNISVNGLYPHNGFFFVDIWEFLKNVYYLFLPLINFYFAFYYLFLFNRTVVLGDKSRDFPAFLVTSIVYFLLNIAYIGAFTNLPLDTPINAIKNSFRLLASAF